MNNEYISDSIITLLAKLGCQDACVSPGARNAPIIFALDKNKNINIHSILDERAAGFYALGMAKKYRSPVALSCTSGTALANLFPAIIEARMSETPLIIVTADRPKKSINNGENQTIYQDNIYGQYVVDCVNINPIKDDINSIANKVNKIFYSSIGLKEKSELYELV